MGHGVTELTTDAEFEATIKGNALVVVDFFAVWCGPCRMIAPFMEELAAAHPNVKFIKVDVDKLPVSSLSMSNTNFVINTNFEYFPYYGNFSFTERRS